MHPDIEHRMGQECQQRGELSEAIAHFRRAQASDPLHLWSRQNLGTILAEVGRCSEAEALLAPLSRALPQDPWGPYARAVVALQFGRPEEQEQLLELALERGLPPSMAEHLRRWHQRGPWKPVDGWETAVQRHLLATNPPEGSSALRPSWENHDEVLSSIDLQPASAVQSCGAAAITAVIPSRDRPDLLEQCLIALERQEGWGHRPSALARVVVVDNGSRQPRTAALLGHWQACKGGSLEVLRLDEPFNWSRLSNAGAMRADTPLLLFLNDDTELLTPNGLARLGGLALAATSGAVGALLVDDRNRVADAGLMGKGEIHRARWRGVGLQALPQAVPRSWWTTDAVTGACLMVSRRHWQQVRFDEGLPLDGNDVAFARALSAKGLVHWILGAVRLRHGVSSSRGLNRLEQWIEAD